MRTNRSRPARPSFATLFRRDALKYSLLLVGIYTIAEIVLKGIPFLRTAAFLYGIPFFAFIGIVGCAMVSLATAIRAHTNGDKFHQDEK